MKRKDKQLLKEVGIVLLISIAIASFVFLLITHSDNRDSKIPRIEEIFKNTTAYKYAIENNANISKVTFVDSISRDTFLRKNGYLTACPYLTFNDFAFIYGRRFIVAINIETFEVECDWVKGMTEC